MADSAFVTAINSGEVRPADFVRRGGAVALRESGRRRLIRAYERRVHIKLRHPMFGDEAAVIDGQLDEYVPLTTR